MNTIDEMWRFKTERFTVICTAEDEWDVDLSWDETGETAEKIASGEWTAFCVKVAVLFDGVEISADYLGQCIYADCEDFVTGHRDTDPMNRCCSLNPRNVGHYFPDMVSTAIKEARQALSNVPKIRAA